MGDCLPYINGNCTFQTMDGTEHTIDGKWDILIAHHPCTYLTTSGDRYFNEEKYGDKARERKRLREEALEFFMQFVKADCDHIAIENPVGVVSTRYRKPDQIINPYQFGHPVMKRTCLWLKGLPKLTPTDVVKPEKTGKDNSYSGNLWYAKDPETGKALRFSDPRTAKERSKTYPGIAAAIADQWGNIC